MLKHPNGWSKASSSSPLLPRLPLSISSPNPRVSICFSSAVINKSLKPGNLRGGFDIVRRNARRRLPRYDEESDDDDDYGHNSEMEMLELYSRSAVGEALLVKAIVDEEETEVLVFKGFSSCLSYRTSPDPTKSVLPARAVIKSIDIIKGPFNPANIEYLEKDLTWEAFQNRLKLN